MMKGLFNYETAYRKYTRHCLDEFVNDNIQYAEIRPNFMFSNQVWKDDGSIRIDNIGIMDLIISEYEAFQKDHQQRVLKGLKVIYCTPRSFSEKQVGDALLQCFQFKMDKRFSPYIAGKLAVDSCNVDSTSELTEYTRLRLSRRREQRQTTQRLQAAVLAIPGPMQGRRPGNSFPLPLRRVA